MPELDSPVSVYSEFQPLKTVVVGRPYPAEDFDFIEDIETRDSLQRIARETEEDCVRLQKIFEQYGAKVLRPTISAPLHRSSGEGLKKTRISNGRWSTVYPNAPLWPRDLTLAVGRKILSVFSRNPGRWMEGQSFYPIFRELYANGADWISMPPPLLSDQARGYEDYEEKEILFHAACFLKCGKDIFHTLPAGEIPGGKGTILGLDWVKRQLPEYRFHGMRRPGHIDGKIALLEPGLLMSWIPREELPLPLQSWDIIFLESKASLPEEFQRLRGRRFYREFVTKWLTEWVGNVDETYFDVNLVSLDEKTVVLNSTNPTLLRELSSRGIECVPFDFRHCHFWDGGLHCMTLDLKRHGPCEDYFK